LSLFVIQLFSFHCLSGSGTNAWRSWTASSLLSRLGSWRTSLWWRTNLAAFLGSIANDFAVDRARNAVVQFVVQFGQHVVLVCSSLVDITNGGRLDNVADDELFDRFVLWNASSAVGAVHIYDMATSVFGASSISPFLSHF
jgi:hypothetical protein